MSFTFRPSVRENVHVIGGFIGGTGSGKTCSALRVATGLAAGKPFAVIDTESRRSLHYADKFSFQHGDLTPPFTPERYLEAILSAEAAGYPVAVVDSMSHEHAGEGGLLDWQESELQRMAGEDPGKRERVKFAAWIKPKTAHKKMLQRILQLRMHLILCFRAEPKMKPQKDNNGKIQFVDAGWLPICAKGLEFELTFSFLLSHEHPGIYRTDGDPAYGHALKLPDELRSCFQEGAPIDESCGTRLAEWGRGGVAKPAPDLAASALISESEAADLKAMLEEIRPKVGEFFRWLKDETGAERLTRIPLAALPDVAAKIESLRRS